MEEPSVAIGRGRKRADGDGMEAGKREARKSKKATALWKRWETFCFGGTDAKGALRPPWRWGVGLGGFRSTAWSHSHSPKDAKELVKVEDKGGWGAGWWEDIDVTVTP